MLGAAAVTAQFVSGKATRDALFLTSLDFTALPAMLIATSVFSIVLVVANARAARRIVAGDPGAGLTFVAQRRAVPARMAAPVEGSARDRRCSSTCTFPERVLLLASGFWLIASERFDPRTAKKRFGQIAARRHAGRPAERARRRARRRRVRRPGHAAAARRACSSAARGWSGGLALRDAGNAPPDRPRRRCERATGALAAARAGRGAVPAPSRRARAARHDRRRAGRLPVQGAGGRDIRTRRQPAPVLRPLLRGHQPADVRPADLARRA